jgi:DNA processing protein
VISRDGREYPPMLEHLPDPPERLWVVGRSLSSLPTCVAVVGTRTPTAYGQEIAGGLAQDLARAGLCVVSGMARGIDSWAHRGALQAGPTVAVLAGGVDVCYPSGNRDLYELIANRGTIVSESPPGTPIRKRRFPIRNRIIAAMSVCTVVVQAGLGSGAMSTARHALSIGRDVLAVPGDVRVDVSAGVHELLYDGAAPCTCAGDILQRVGADTANDPGARRLDEVPADMDLELRTILELMGGEQMAIESVGIKAGVLGAPLVVAISRLELAGWIARSPGGAVRRTR